jgi:hypothetical protein
MQNRACHEASITAVPATLGLRTPSVKPGNHPDSRLSFGVVRAAPCISRESAHRTEINRSLTKF